MQFLRLNTQSKAIIGPILSIAGGYSTIDAAVWTAARVILMRAVAGAAVAVGERTILPIIGGMYFITLTAADLNVPGPMVLSTYSDGAYPTNHPINVLAPSMYDAMFSTGIMPSDMLYVAGDSNAAARLADSASTMQTITAGAGSTSGRIATNLTSATSGTYAGRTIVFKTGPLAGQAASITAYNGATKELTTSLLTGAPLPGDLAVIV